MRRSVFLDELTDPEVGSYLRGYPAMLLVPTGATEPHGQHAPLGTDVIILREVCKRVGEAKSALVAPPTAYGLSTGHAGSSGLAYLRANTFVKLIEDVTLSVAEAGFRRIVFVNGQSTNYPALNLALLQVSPRLPEGTRAYAISYWEALPRADEYAGIATGFHANAGETSAVLAARPDTVKMEEAVAGWPRFPALKGPAMPTILSVFDSRQGARRRALPLGVWGDPTTGSAELGAKFFEEITSAMCNVIDDIEKTNAQVDIPQPPGRGQPATGSR